MAFYPMRRTVLLHNHLFKNAGTTIDSVLRRNFGRSFVDHRDDDAMLRGAEYLGPYIALNPWIRAIATHHFRPPLPMLEGVQVLTLVMLRCPFERVTSVYDFERRRPDGNSQMSRHARNVSLREFVSWGIQPDVSATLCNFHVIRSLPPHINWHAEISEEQYAEAEHYVESVPLLGLVDRFDESMVLFEQTLRPVWPSIDLSYVKKNVGPRAVMTSSERMDALAREIGDDMMQSLRRCNRYDVRLLEFARAVFNERLSALAGVREKVAAFRERCRRRSTYWGRCRSAGAFFTKRFRNLTGS
jgi:hypothetical protein